MQTERTFIDDLKHQYKHGGVAIRLIFVNVAVFLLIRILDVFFSLGGMTHGGLIDTFVSPIFGLHTGFFEFITHPWGILTSMFMHFSLLHLLFNMLFLYFAGRMFEQLFGQKRLLYTYLLGGIFGGLLEIVAHAVFPRFELLNDIVIGASGSIMAIFVAIAFHRPNLKVHLFGILPVRMIILAVIFILTDLLNLGNGDGVAHFAHLGGAILGMWSVQNLYSSGNIITQAQGVGDAIIGLFKRSDRKRFKVKRGGNPRFKTDEEYNADAKERQEKIDRILDKISKSGYESLTKSEKEFLFNQSKNG